MHWICKASTDFVLKIEFTYVKQYTSADVDLLYKQTSADEYKDTRGSYQNAWDIVRDIVFILMGNFH